MAKESTLRISYGGLDDSVRLSAEPLTIGRAPDNGLSLMEPAISWHHATVWIEGEQVWIRDLNSTNGITLNGERLRGKQIFPPGATAVLGHKVILQLPNALPTPATQYVLEDLNRARRFALSTGETDLVELGVAPEGAVQLSAAGRLTLQRGDVEIPLRLNVAVAISAARFQVVEAKHEDTLARLQEPYPYRLTVRLDGPRGPEAVLWDRVSKRSCTIVSQNRVVLLYLLASQIRADMKAERPAKDIGWCEDTDLTSGIWGKVERSASSLPVLIHRLRKEVSRTGLNHAFLEKGRKVFRARLIDVVIE